MSLNIQNNAQHNQIAFYGGGKPNSNDIRNMLVRMRRELGGNETKEMSDEARRALQSTRAAERHELVDAKNSPVKELLSRLLNLVK